MSERFSFEVVDALDYDELRPEYAPEAVAWVAERCGIGPGSSVVDLAAGTGRLLGWFLQLGVDVIAVEPAANMRAVLEERFPTVRAIVATAESMPSSWATRSTTSGATRRWRRSIASCAQEEPSPCSGHGRPRREQLKIPGMRAIYEAIDDTHGEAEIMAAHRSWSEPPATVDGFDPFERREFPATHVLPAARLADLYATFSDVLSLPDPTRAWLLDRIRQLSRGLPETLHLRQRTVVDLCVAV